MKRENRRVVAMSWGAGDDLPPPKPSRMPQTDSSSTLSLSDNSTAPQTYIVAQNATVLAQIMRENESRPFNPSAYNTPATVFNTLGVHVDATKNVPEADELPTLRTVMLPASELMKLKPNINENSYTNKSFAPNTCKPEEKTKGLGSGFDSHGNIPSVFPIPCEIINASTQKVHSVDPMYKALQTTNNAKSIIYSPNSTHGDLILKSRSLERNTQSNAAWISSIDRVQNTSQLKQTRSYSLTRQLSSGSEISCTNSGFNLMENTRSTSLERGVRAINYGYRTNSLDCRNDKQALHNLQLLSKNNEQGSLQCTQSVSSMYSVINTQNLVCGNLDRNRQGTEIVPFIFSIAKL